MAEIDKVPLLLEDEKEILDEEDETFHDRHPEGIEKVSSVQSEMLDLSESGKRRRRYYMHNTELIVAAFVVAFDTKKGMEYKVTVYYTKPHPIDYVVFLSFE